MPKQIRDGQLIDVDSDGVSVQSETAELFTVDESLTCEECGEPLTYSGRGRPPKRCANCRKQEGRKPSSSAGAMRGEAALRAALTDRYHNLALAVSLVDKNTAAQIIAKTEAAVDADISYARQNPKFRKWLEGGLEKTGLAQILAVHATMFAPAFIAAGKRGAGIRKPRPAGQQQNVRNIHEQSPPKPSPKSADVTNAGAMPGMPG